MNKNMMMVKEAAAYLGISRGTLYSWILKRSLPHYIDLANKYRYFLKEDLDKFKSEQLKKSG